MIKNSEMYEKNRTVENGWVVPYTGTTNCKKDEIKKE